MSPCRVDRVLPLQRPAARRVGMGLAFVTLLSVSCVPDLQPAVPGGSSQCVDGGQRLSYADAPDSLKSQELEDAIAVYSTIAGQWAMDFLCPPDSATTRTLGMTIEGVRRDDVTLEPLCRGGFIAVTQCRIVFSGQEFPELAGQSSDFDVRFLRGPVIDIGGQFGDWDYGMAGQTMDPSYNPSWDSLTVGIRLDSAGAMQTRLSFAFKPSWDGTHGSRMGYDCTSGNAVKVGP